ncbi:hypothetical protein ND981_11250 [Vibrio diabolicus]|uniref:hypothetical protein n=1 Tax=Vibrio diabolicus TaxID=50719 RepID=UPI00215EBD0A|nr:hypothetical protein [Vibrio diabolicus]MCS0333508.1 hypothetical protein [Vibrio diabolicus]
MNFKVFTGQFLAGNGVPVLIVSKPSLSGNVYTVEWHAFYSGDSQSYSVHSVSFNNDSEQSCPISDDELMDLARTEAEEYIYQQFSEKSSVQYQAMLAGFGYKISESDTNILLRLHLRNILTIELEELIYEKSDDSEIKSFIGSIKKMGRVTSAKKI